MSFRVNRVDYEYFGPFRKASVDFSAKGLTVIEGQIHGMKGCDSNGCLAGGTLIDCPRDLKKYPKGVPLRELVGKRPFVYAWSNGRMVVRRAVKVWRTKRNVPVIRVRVTKYATNKGAGQGNRYIPPLELVGTPDHPVLLSDGVTWQKLGELAPGDSICSLYRRWDGHNRAVIRWTGHARPVSESRFVCAEMYGDVPLGDYHAHHVDGDPYNNAPTNLRWKSAHAHLSEHTSERNREGTAGWRASGVHPRGMFGKHHTTATRRHLSEVQTGVPKPHRVNHAVISVESAGTADVYDMRVPGADSFVANGMVVHNSGKSFLFDGIAWALFGRCIRDKYKGDDILHLGHRKDCFVRVCITGGPKDIEVVRFRKHSINGNKVVLGIGGKDASLGTDPATTAAIENAIGMGFSAFCNSVAFGVREDVRSFFAASDSERKGILERILGLEVYGAAEKIARVRLKGIVEDIGILDLRKTKLSAALSEKKHLLRKLSLSPDAEEIALQYSVRRLTVQMLHRRLRVQKDEFDSANAVYSQHWDAFAALQDKYKADSTVYDQLVARLQKDVRKLERAVGELEGERKPLVSQLSRVKKLDGAVCPTCQQMVSPETTKSLTTKLQAQLKALDAGIAAAQEQVAAVNAEMAELAEPEAPLRSDELNAAMEAVERVREAQAKTRHLIELERARVEEMQAAQAKMAQQEDDIRDEIGDVEAEIQVVDEEIAGHKTAAEHVSFWVDGFGNQGLKSLMIEAEIPAINRKATTYAQTLLGDGAIVRLSATSKLKSRDLFREKLDVEGSIPGCTLSYAGASKGQRKRMDLALLLAFRDIVSARNTKSFDQLFVDELFDGLDVTGTACVSDLLRELSTDFPVGLITHNNALKLIADRVVTVVHAKGAASIK